MSIGTQRMHCHEPSGVRLLAASALSFPPRRFFLISYAMVDHDVV
jgi:hypothetical protein